jgi:3-hydroxybutyryl-CoA dehydratase
MTALKTLPPRLVEVVRTSDYGSMKKFADLSNDYNPIHIDREFAATTPMKGLIAHGPMATIMLWQSLYKTLGAGTLQRVSLELRFLKPVRENDTATAGGDARSAESGCYDVWVRNQNGEAIVQGTARLRAASAG